ncbi:dTDP-4-dehydrorhamnose reductase [Burkholderia cenocepacia]|uniref:dTDP-4-dehydrorhamnose reductase n=1 Tax=Burkholderia cenocepacia TaxID=95486 RepID=UPI00073A8C84|nr:dTDP-4-dehydrorhamnose reductase [Burkholderia cenocepacia]ALV57687.1 dTDP-4-dehydrorhamnose reductase [Burkholderia cenocepacia]AQQ48815.1 dTDP-4-dehydrorhamnose reductase [Burkholderia cenocepacia]MBR8350675.1 dTDP-4-dehydrorhamnose reductase [Burkholderia cenocepacia]MDI9649364.1 dTDP-4-dehydrorhamnose reductase [Burkholderia cenocepacia]MEB2601450.1 dTDP-4-dehydrorhamnose reductase [Burkholderia cenocepacia]
MPRILITGSSGQIGFELERALAPLGELLVPKRKDLDLSDIGTLAERLNALQPDVIVNPAAYTAVDLAESQSTLAHAINADAPGAMASWASNRNIPFIHYSTDYVFDGTKAEPYLEDDATHPLSVYGQSKLAGEAAVRAACSRHLILRTSWVVGAHGKNFLKTILRLAQEREQLNVVADQVGSPTTASFIADVTAHVLARVFSPAFSDWGTYHLAAAGETTWHDYARRIVRLAEESGIALKLKQDAIQAVPTSAYPTAATRPANSRLNCGKLANTFDLRMQPWQDGIDHVFAQLQH